jgi:hypothetical protein
VVYNYGIWKPTKGKFRGHQIQAPAARLSAARWPTPSTPILCTQRAGEAVAAN